MPELPEVEVTKRAIAPQVEGKTLLGATVRHHGLRWPVPKDLSVLIAATRVARVSRRGKYLLIACHQGRTLKGHMIVHLGMTGSLRFTARDVPPKRHEHVDFDLGARLMRYTDPRRFGAVLWHPASAGPVEAHPLLASLGVEPLTDAFSGATLKAAWRGKKVAVKQALLAGDAVVGVGNIYASESLFRAGIRPTRAAGRITLARCEKLRMEVKAVLSEAINKGGSTLRDFHSDGEAGYFQLDYTVYDREGQPCKRCGTTIKRIVQGQRSTFFCPVCQT
jgi:formamidopyrimidine-DNA glycosylase